MNLKEGYGYIYMFIILNPAKETFWKYKAHWYQKPGFKP